MSNTSDYGKLIGVDIGGTKTAVITGTPTGEILEKVKFPTPRSWRATLDEVCKIVSGFKEKNNVEGVRTIGVSCGGPLDSRKGLIQSPPNLPGWDDVPVCQILEDKLNIPTFLENDANACALAEREWGAGKGCDNLIFLTFGTGLGAGLVLNGKLYSGTSGLAGEIGHIRVSSDGPIAYGKSGSWEGFCSGAGISRHYSDLYDKTLSGKEICRLANSGDRKALNVISVSSKYLGHGIAILLDILNPEMIIIGSIFTRDEPLFRKGMEEVIRQEALPGAVANCRIVAAGLGESLGDLAALGVAINGSRIIKQQNRGSGRSIPDT